MYSNRRSGWRDTGYNINPQQNYWEVVVATGKGSSSTSNTGTTTIYTMDGTTGTMTKRGSVDRVCSGKTYYRIGWPGQGPGKIARVVSWNRVLAEAELQELQTALSPSPVEGATFDLNAASQKGKAPVESIAKMKFNNFAVKKDGRLPYWDLSGSYLQRSGGGSLKDGRYYTHAYVLKWRASNKGWRTLLRHNQDHCIIVKDGATDLGMYSNRNGAFQDTGYNVRGHAWPLVCVSVRIKKLHTPLHCIR